MRPPAKIFSGAFCNFCIKIDASSSEASPSNIALVIALSGASISIPIASKPCSSAGTAMASAVPNPKTLDINLFVTPALLATLDKAPPVTPNSPRGSPRKPPPTSCAVFL